MNLKKCDAAAIAVLAIFMTGSPIFANQVFAISSIAKIIDSVVGPCTQESGKFMYLVCKIRPLTTEQWGCSEESAAKR
jgi:hypothetical protein